MSPKASLYKMTHDTYAGLFGSHVDELADRMSARALAARAHYLPTDTAEVAMLDDRRRAV
jgi:hypothetical protein